MLAALGSPLVQAQDQIGAGFFNGHYYEVYRSLGTSWATAKTYADDLIYADEEAGIEVFGHLATATSPAEDDFIEMLRSDAVNDDDLSRFEFWIGGSQSAGGAEPGGGWTWENGEGPIPGDNGQAAYANWLNGEPNNLGGNEEHLGVGLGDAFGWNDESALGNIAGFIVEYDIPVPVTDCIGGDGCATVTNDDGDAGQTLTFPATANQDATIAFQASEFTDPRVAANKCGIDPLVLFDGDLTIPPYLCGSPKFIVVKTDTDLELFEGTVLVENDVLVVLPDNEFICQVTTDDPLQQRDVVVWQSTDSDDMRENSQTAASISPKLVGAAGEFTNQCINPSRGLVRAASFFVIGMHIDFGIDYSTDSLSVYENFVTLTRYKLLLLRQAVRGARADGAITRVASVALEALVNAAIVHLDRGRNRPALVSIRLFNALAGAINYQAVAGENYHGEFLSRGKNIEFMLADKLIPNQP